MSKHILFLVHGMGVHAENNWASGVIEKLKTLSENYSSFKQKPLDEYVKMVPLNYDHILSEAVQAWKKDAGEVATFAKASGLDHADALDWLTAGGDKEKFFWTHVADVLIYRFFSHYRNRIKIDVIDQVSREVDRQMNATNDAICSILAHSLGTSVIHDAIHNFGNERWKGKPNPFGPLHWRFHSIFMLANVSRLLQTIPRAYGSIIKPGPVSDKNSYFTGYYNFRHEIDPIPFIKKFKPDGWDNLVDVGIKHFHDWNIHGFEHYLDNPEVHIRILRAITNHWTITDEENDEAIKNYAQFGGKLAESDELKERIKELDSIRDNLADKPSTSEWIKAFIQALKVINRLKDLTS